VSLPAIRGVLPVLQVPFCTDESIDYGALRDEAEWCVRQGVHGLVLGMVSEVLRLDDTERIEVTRTLSSVAESTHLAVVISVGSESSKVSCDRARAATDAGATAVMATPPITGATDDAGLHAYYRRLTECTHLPVIVQDASGYVGRPMSIAFQATLVDELGHRILFKPEAHPIGQRLSQLRDSSNGRAKILEGTGGVALIDSYRRGVIGTMPAADLCWALVALWQALEAGDEATATRIHGPLASIVSMQTSLDAFIAIEKHLLLRQGVLPNANLREPAGYRLDSETAKEVDRITDILDEACRSSRRP